MLIYLLSYSFSLNGITVIRKTVLYCMKFQNTLLWYYDLRLFWNNELMNDSVPFFSHHFCCTSEIEKVPVCVCVCVTHLLPHPTRDSSLKYGRWGKGEVPYQQHPGGGWERPGKQRKGWGSQTTWLDRDPVLCSLLPHPLWPLLRRKKQIK